VPTAPRADLPQLGETLRRLRLERGLELGDVAEELGVTAKDLRALEWDRQDLLGNGVGDQIQRDYAAFLGLEIEAPAATAPPKQLPAPLPSEVIPVEPEAAEPETEPRPSREVTRDEWLPLLAALGPPLVIALPFIREDVPVVTLGLVFISSLLLVAATLPQSVLARGDVSSVRYASYRQPLGLAALGILVPVALFSVLGALS
jgi:transcriptional regulator with XRE-family HTH domain